MKKLLRKILLKPVLWMVQKFSSRPNQQRIFMALSKLFDTIQQEPGKRGLVIPFEEHAGKFIILSDQHKGAGDGADDFILSAPNYMAALAYYHENDFMYINLGDSEELWENSLGKVKKQYPETFVAEKKFLDHNRFIKIFGNHDLYWDNDPMAWWQLKNIYQEKLKVYEGVVLKTIVNSQQTTAITTGNKSNIAIPDTSIPHSQSSITNNYTPLTILLTHGHQGDSQSDGNWFSKYFVANIWAPLQAFLQINPNTPAYDAVKKTLHNVIMYEWSSKQKNTLLVTGHTHQPVFKSFTHLERLYQQQQQAKKENNLPLLNEIEKEIVKRDPGFKEVTVDYTGTVPSYFNSGCCCFNDGDITGIEIADGKIRLIKWTTVNEKPQREVLEETVLSDLIKEL